MLVLCITLLVSAVLLSFTFNYLKDYVDEQVQYEIQLKLREAQFLALANQRTYYARYTRERIFKTFDVPYGESHFEQMMPSTVKMYLGYTNNSIQFIRYSPSMRSPRIGVLAFETKRGKVRYTMNIGKGRFSYSLE